MIRTSALALALAVVISCGEPDGEGRRGGAGGPGGGWGEEPAAAVPVEVTPVLRRTIAALIETNGTLEAENEVDLVARTSGPMTHLAVEEGMRVARGALLARIDDREIRADLEVARVTLEDARLAWERAEALSGNQLISEEDFEQARTRYETARAQVEAIEIELGYTVVRAPFAGLVVTRYVKLAEQVGPGTPLFRLSDFDPLLCVIQVPERELDRLSVGQLATLRVEAWPDHAFQARVLRVSPVVDAGTGTVKVTLEAEAEERLRPGMFARVYLETARRPDALVIPKAALALESINDTVFVVDGGTASRRDVTLGFRQGDVVEVRSGVNEGERVVTVGQDGLSDGTPVQILGDAALVSAEGGPAAGASEETAPDGPPRGRPDLASMTPEQLERAKSFMRARGMSEQQIEERIRQARERAGSDSETGGP